MFFLLPPPPFSLDFIYVLSIPLREGGPWLLAKCKTGAETSKAESINIQL